MKRIKIEVEVDTGSLSVTYGIITNILKEIEKYEAAKIISVEESEKATGSAILPGHVPGCRITRSGDCTCGPVPR